MARQFLRGFCKINNLSKRDAAKAIIDDLGNELGECVEVISLLHGYIVGVSKPSREEDILGGLGMLARRLDEMQEYYDVELRRYIPQGPADG